MADSLDRNYFLVESPLQLICATEARECFGEGLLILKETGSPKNNRQMQDLVKLFDWQDVRTFTRGDSRRFASIKLLKLLSDEIRPGRHSRIFLGDYRSRWMQLGSNRAASRAYMMDDGLAMLETMDKLQQRQALVGQSRFNGLLSRLLGLGTVQNRPIHAFSFLPIQPASHNTEVLPHQFERVRERLRGVAQLDPKSACFIGSRYVENGIVTEPDYLALLHAAIAKCEGAGRRLVYLPHRYEDEAALESVRALGVEIRYLDYPVELAYLMGEINYGQVMGLYSTALISLSLLVEGLDTCSFRPEDSAFKSRQAGIFKCYDLLEELPYIEVETRQVGTV